MFHEVEVLSFKLNVRQKVQNARTVNKKLSLSTLRLFLDVSKLYSLFQVINLITIIQYPSDVRIVIVSFQ